MKSTWNYKLLQHLNSKKADGGFTLIELLVVIIIIGILAAIALPAFLNQANRAKQSEATTYVGSINRAQQAYRLENTLFSDTIDNLSLGVPTSTDNYVYGSGATNAHTATPTPNTLLASALAANVVAAPKDPNLIGYAGVVYTNTDVAGNATTKSLFCKGAIGDAPTVTLATQTCP